MIRKTSAGGGVELEWFKSSYSDSSSGNDCVEIAVAPGTVHVRDSKDTRGPRFAVADSAWADFVTYARRA
ncbi:DUF397 domain-containing protein [Streptomyces sp. VRA16 Mangrove soil]|uniref:DUF397 domain-containing protein n=1 Tax=Streptomyces sp. VRA16 Mangrove soil TaxID=2817434 RepID=UPI001A9F60B5|nr:DUF397 domain-containing protein [Streptomyces sp. VRA16 Mangrove soil]MBO1335007.1 DUF397 domain-containing protein [Streptomyces sp. VRA16 Mangrove soil]